MAVSPIAATQRTVLDCGIASHTFSPISKVPVFAGFTRLSITGTLETKIDESLTALASPIYQSLILSAALANLSIMTAVLTIRNTLSAGLANTEGIEVSWYTFVTVIAHTGDTVIGSSTIRAISF